MLETSNPVTIVREVELSDVVGKYLQECAGRGLARSTIAGYTWGLGKLRICCRTLPPTHQQLAQVLGDKTLGGESRHDLRRVLETFFRWSWRHYRVPNVLGGIQLAPKRKKLPRVLTVDELSAVVDACVDARERALVALVMDTGLRVGEIANLTKGDVGSDYLRVTGKVGDRQVPVSPQVRELLLRLGEDRCIWVGRVGRLTDEGLKQVFSRLFTRAGLIGRKLGGPHVLRHTFGTFYIRAGGNVSVLQIILGHEDLATTMIYVHLAAGDVVADHAQHSPIRSLGLL